MSIGWRDEFGQNLGHLVCTSRSLQAIANLKSNINVGCKINAAALVPRLKNPVNLGCESRM